jgi:predicted MFS family arabinose efflux permease
MPIHKRLLFLALGMFPLGTDSFVVAGVLPEVAHSTRVSIGAAGQMTTIYPIAACAVCSLVVAELASLVIDAAKKRQVTSTAAPSMAADAAP